MLLIVVLIVFIFLLLTFTGLLRPSLVLPFGLNQRWIVLLLYLTPVFLIVGTAGYFLSGKDTELREPQYVISLDLYDQGLDKLPDNLTEYVNLEELNLKNNHIKSLDREKLLALKHLKYLNLHNNPISEIPEWITRLPLIDLTLDGTHISSIPDTVRASIPEIYYRNTPLSEKESAEKAR